MVTLECTAGAVGGSIMYAAAAARPATPAFGKSLLLPTVRTRSLAGVGLNEVTGSDSGCCDQMTAVVAVKDIAVKGIDATYFPTRLGPPPDSPPVN